MDKERVNINLHKKIWCGVPAHAYVHLRIKLDDNSEEKLCVVEFIVPTFYIVSVRVGKDVFYQSDEYDEVLLLSEEGSYPDPKTMAYARKALARYLFLLSEENTSVPVDILNSED